MLVNCCERRLRFDDVEVEKGSEAGQRENEVRFDNRIAVASDMPLAYRLPDETFDQRASMPQSEANLLTQRWVVHRFEHVSRVHTTGGTGVRSERKHLREDYSQHVARMRRLVERPQCGGDSARCLFGSELHGEGQHLGA